MKKKVLVFFAIKISEKEKDFLQKHPEYTTIISPKDTMAEIQELGRTHLPLEDFVDAGSIYEANELVVELSQTTFPNGEPVSKSFMYKGYELWWINYDTLFFLYCLPYTQYKRLLEYLLQFDNIHFYKPAFPRLFRCFLNAYDKEVAVLNAMEVKSPSSLPLGVVCQILITCILLPVAIVRRSPIMVYISDEFHKTYDYHFRMGFIYNELRRKKLPFIEFIRSIEPWRTVIKHAVRRNRPVVYTDAVSFLARLMCYVTGGRIRARRIYNQLQVTGLKNPDEQFKLKLATQYLMCVYDDVWAIRIMRVLLRVIGVKSALIVAAMGRNFQLVLACKLNNIPITGILHGVASQHYNVYDFMPKYDGAKILSVEKYGVWSDWWKEYYVKNSRVYQADQLYVSGPMRPLLKEEEVVCARRPVSGPIKVLLVSEQLAAPEEVLPYLEVLLNNKDISLYVVFRPYLDGFGTWLKTHHSHILERIGEDHIFSNGIKEALPVCDIVIGSHSTAVLESLLTLKPMVFFHTNKWGDYFELKTYDAESSFFAQNPAELMNKIKRSLGVSNEVLQDLQKRFFGNPYQNGSKWAVEEVEKTVLYSK